MQASLMRLEPHQYSAGIYMVVSLYIGNGIQQRVSDPNLIVLNGILQY
jgi:hypothetical protein